MKIEAVLFDMGGTLEDLHYDRALRLAALPGILAVLAGEGIVLPGDDSEILDRLLARNAEYKAWSEKARIESPAASIWSDWNLRDFSLPADKVGRIAEELAYVWETSFFARKLRPDAASTLDSLAKRGYRLGVISNTSSRTQVFRTLEAYGIADRFECVVLSSVEGVRKPHPAIFETALKAMGSRAESAAYVGDTLSRDVIGAKEAGYALAFQIRSFLTAGSDASVRPGSAKPDYLVESLSEIVAILDRLAERSDQA
jgi:putative hydrolase of the HAD superfamily